MIIRDINVNMALVTSKGIEFNGKIFTNGQMIKHQWFELARRSGDWTIPVLHCPEDPEHLILLDTGGFEIAISVETPKDIPAEILESYYQALNSLKERMRDPYRI
ncbi:hypothetical protein EV294_102746 [Paenibacillus sp. BK033]|uniref:hypothetical protein n=1 Tax=Paenibacillus sp. BK033 TaxID=2512133 RepID=UPI001043B9F0|nr:hypothetical protein [Paenibacillus sp. BK033]TCM99446.1 hypothetical protein EV294_102746 [Paenibacillus sp. BK033]